MLRLLLIAAIFFPTLILRAQIIGTVPIADAQIANTTPGLLPVANGRADLTGTPTITAGTHSAEISLTRGGTLRVCQSTPLHLAQTLSQALLLTLDRGAVEIRTKATPADSLLTPDLRFTPLAPGPLDLQVHVSSNGDTCVDNRGRHAPPLTIVDAFGQSSYLLKPNQHVLFEHGSLREVVDRETVPCGCPPDSDAAHAIPLAEAALRGGTSAPPVTPAQAAAANPFPAAVSGGLAPPSPLPAEAPGVTHVQVASTLSYDPPPPHPETSAPIPAVAALPPPDPVRTSKPGAFTAIGHFFKRLFVR